MFGFGVYMHTYERHFRELKAIKVNCHFACKHANMAVKLQVLGFVS
jgi:hypothetical protein